MDHPRPLFVFYPGDDGQYVTCIDSDRNDKPYLICGTSNGFVSIWCLESGRLLKKFSPLSFKPEIQINQTTISTIKYLNVQSKLLCHFLSGDVLLFELSNHHEPPDQWTFQLIKHWEVSQLTYSKYFCLSDRYFVHFNRINSNLIEFVDVHRLEQKFLFNICAKEDGIVTSSYFMSGDNPSTFYCIIGRENVLIMYCCCLKPDQSVSSDAIFVSKLNLSTIKFVTQIDFNEKTMLGVICSVSNEIYIFRINKESSNLQFEQKIKRIPTNSNQNHCCSIRPDGKIFATASNDGRIRVFSLKTGNPLVVLTYHSMEISTVNFSPDLGNPPTPRYLLSASCKDGSVSIWSLYNKDCNHDENVQKPIYLKRMN